MSKRFSILLVVLTIVSGLIGGVISERIFTPKVAIAQESELGSRVHQLESEIPQLEKRIDQLESKCSSIGQLELRINQIEVDIEMNLNQILQRQKAEASDKSKTKDYTDPKTGGMFRYNPLSNSFTWRKMVNDNGKWVVAPNETFWSVAKDKVPDYVKKELADANGETNLFDSFVPDTTLKNSKITEWKGKVYGVVNGRKIPSIWTKERSGGWRNNLLDIFLPPGGDLPDKAEYKMSMQLGYYTKYEQIKVGNKLLFHDKQTGDYYDTDPFDPLGGQKKIDSKLGKAPWEK